MLYIYQLYSHLVYVVGHFFLCDSFSRKLFSPFILSFDLFYFCLICCISLSRLWLSLTFLSHVLSAFKHTNFSIVDPYSIATANQTCLRATRTIKSNDHPSMDSKFRKVFQQRFQVAAVQKKSAPPPIECDRLSIHKTYQETEAHKGSNLTPHIKRRKSQ